MNFIEQWIARKVVSRMGEWLAKIFKGDLGWKTVSAAVVLVTLVILHATNVITVDQFDKYAKLAEALGFVGLRDAIGKLPK